ncbi:YbhB/YbcL family Raf kinase inhibitor-like protein [uncultured Massilia sp.]|uniref:YbhB/YbcL family Raf kinase inhibitor-like protein n=1 Tax=uncultured Massilia sp. TaxID=169973 RepID=UPI0025F71051|nr:YbhB/YbcL family Raf kinase inhibitor-like protein [uncultured Massilia sp.]
MAVLSLVAAGAWAQQGDGTNVGAQVHIFKPDKVAPTPQRMAGIKAPAGFAVTPFATGLKNVRILAVAPNGNVYASRRDQGDVLLLRDANGDGRADGQPEIVASRAGAHGLAIRDNKLYLVTVKELFVADIQPDGRLGALKMLAGDLPDAGQHANRTIAFGPDGMLYLSVGSTCNDCNETNQENATILRFNQDFSNRNIVASGLRNTIGFDWQPRTGELWGFDHGIDFLGDDEQPEELNKIETGKQYGWPHVYAGGAIYPQSTPVGEIKKEDWKAHSTPMVLGYTAHAAPMQFLFYTGTGFPAEYQGDAFATMRGSWNRKTASGYEIVRVRFQDGQAKSIEPFVTGFLTDGGRTHIARPVGLALAKDGALLMADDANGTIYRIAYTGNAQRAATALKAPAGPMREQAGKGSGVPIAFARPQTQAQGKLAVNSSSFPANGAMPAKYSEYADGVAPALSWSAVPNAESYVVIMEDPDAKPVTPVVHWLAWNIPAAVTRLPEGLQEQPRLTEPDGVLQGRTTHGSTGWRGPQPPVGDPPHHYHFQVYALDRMLDVPWGADRDTLLQAMQGHVLAKGELVGTYAQKQKPQK